MRAKYKGGWDLLRLLAVCALLRGCAAECVAWSHRGCVSAATAGGGGGCVGWPSRGDFWAKSRLRLRHVMARVSRRYYYIPSACWGEPAVIAMPVLC